MKYYQGKLFIEQKENMNDCLSLISSFLFTRKYVFKFFTPNSCFFGGLICNVNL